MRHELIFKIYLSSNRVSVIRTGEVCKESLLFNISHAFLHTFPVSKYLAKKFVFQVEIKTSYTKCLLNILYQFLPAMRGSLHTGLKKKVLH